MFIGLLGRKTAAASLADAPRRVLDELKEICLVGVVLPTCVARPDDCVYMSIIHSHAIGKVQM